MYTNWLNHVDFIRDIWSKLDWIHKLHVKKLVNGGIINPNIYIEQRPQGEIKGKVEPRVDVDVEGEIK